MNITEGVVRLPDGTRLAYRDFGEGPPIVIPGHACWLLPDLEWLGKGRRVIAYDSRSRGASDPAPTATLTIDQMARDLEEVCRQLGVRTPSLFAWSHTAAVAALHASRASDVAQLVMIGYLPPTTSAPSAAFGAAHAGARASVERARLQLRAEQDAKTPDGSDGCREHVQRFYRRFMGKPDSLKYMQADPCRFANEWPDDLQLKLVPILSSLRSVAEGPALNGIPRTLVVCGDEDPSFHEQRDWSWEFAEIRVTVMHGVGHFPWLEARQSFKALVDDFLPRDGDVGWSKTVALDPTGPSG